MSPLDDPKPETHDDTHGLDTQVIVKITRNLTGPPVTGKRLTGQGNKFKGLPETAHLFFSICIGL